MMDSCILFVLLASDILSCSELFFSLAVTNASLPAGRTGATPGCYYIFIWTLKLKAIKSISATTTSSTWTLTYLFLTKEILGTSPFTDLCMY